MLLVEFRLKKICELLKEFMWVYKFELCGYRPHRKKKVNDYLIKPVNFFIHNIKIVFYKFRIRKFSVSSSRFFYYFLNKLNMYAYGAERIFNFMRNTGCKIRKSRKTFHAVKQDFLIALFGNVIYRNN